MSKTIDSTTPARQRTYEELEAEARAAGLSLPDYLHAEHLRTRERLTPEEIMARMCNREKVSLTNEQIVALIHEGRDERDHELAATLNDRR
ncbi:MAG TPA: hypothetical protein VF618_27440 [Thermoanaerobaculia bacterium]